MEETLARILRAGSSGPNLQTHSLRETFPQATGLEEKRVLVVLENRSLLDQWAEKIGNWKNEIEEYRKKYAVGRNAVATLEKEMPWLKSYRTDSKSIPQFSFYVAEGETEAGLYRDISYDAVVIVEQIPGDETTALVRWINSTFNRGGEEGRRVTRIGVVHSSPEEPKGFDLYKVPDRYRDDRVSGQLDRVTHSHLLTTLEDLDTFLGSLLPATSGLEEKILVVVKDSGVREHWVEQIGQLRLPDGGRIRAVGVDNLRAADQLLEAGGIDALLISADPLDLNEVVGQLILKRNPPDQPPSIPILVVSSSLSMTEVREKLDSLKRQGGIVDFVNLNDLARIPGRFEQSIQQLYNKRDPGFAGLEEREGVVSGRGGAAVDASTDTAPIRKQSPLWPQSPAGSALLRTPNPSQSPPQSPRGNKYILKPNSMASPAIALSLKSQGIGLISKPDSSTVGSSTLNTSIRDRDMNSWRLVVKKGAPMLAIIHQNYRGINKNEPAETEAAGLEEGLPEEYLAGVQKVQDEMNRSDVQTPLTPGEVRSLAQLFEPSGRAAVVALDQRDFGRWVPKEGPYPDVAAGDVWYRPIIALHLLREAQEREQRVGFLFPRKVIEDPDFKQLRSGTLPDHLRPFVPEGVSLAGVPFLAQGEQSDAPRWKQAEQGMTVQESIRAGASGYKTNVFLWVPIPGGVYHPYWQRLLDRNIQWTRERAEEVRQTTQGRGFGYIPEAVIFAAPPRDFVPNEEGVEKQLRDQGRSFEEFVEELKKNGPAEWAIGAQFDAWIVSKEREEVEASDRFAQAHQQLTEWVVGSWKDTPGITLIKLAGPYFVATDDQWVRRQSLVNEAIYSLKGLVGGRVLNLTRDRPDEVFFNEFNAMVRSGLAAGGLVGRTVWDLVRIRTADGSYTLHPLGSDEFQQGIALSRKNLGKVFDILDRGTASVWSTYGITSKQADALIAAARQSIDTAVSRSVGLEETGRTFATEEETQDFIITQLLNPDRSTFAVQNLLFMTDPNKMLLRLSEILTTMEAAFSDSEKPMDPIRKAGGLRSLAYLAYLLHSPAVRSYSLGPNRIDPKGLDEAVKMAKNTLKRLEALEPGAAKEVQKKWRDRLLKIQLKDVELPYNAETNPGTGFLAEWANRFKGQTLLEWVEHLERMVDGSRILKIRQVTGEILGNDYGPGISELVALWFELVMMNPTLAERAILEDKDLQAQVLQRVLEYVREHPDYKEEDVKWTFLMEATMIAGRESREALLPIFVLTSGWRGRVSFQVNARADTFEGVVGDVAVLARQFGAEAREVILREYIHGEVLTPQLLEALVGKKPPLNSWGNTFYKVDGSLYETYGRIQRDASGKEIGRRDVLTDSLKYLETHDDLILAGVDTDSVIVHLLSGGLPDGPVDVNITAQGSVAGAVAGMLAQLIGHAKARAKGFQIHADIVTKMAGRMEAALRWISIHKIEEALAQKGGEEWDALKARLAEQKEGAEEARAGCQAELGMVLPRDAAIKRAGPAIIQRAEEIFDAVIRHFERQGVRRGETGNLLASTRVAGANDRTPHLVNTSRMHARGLFPVFHAFIELRMPQQEFDDHLALLKATPQERGVIEKVTEGADRAYLDEVLASSIGKEFREVYDLNEDEVKLLARLLRNPEEELHLAQERIAQQWGNGGLRLDQLRDHPFARHSVAGDWGTPIPTTEEGKDQAPDQFMFSVNQLAARALVAGRSLKAAEQYNANPTVENLQKSAMTFLLEPLAGYAYNRMEFNFQRDVGTFLTTGQSLPKSPLGKRAASTLRLFLSADEPGYAGLREGLNRHFPNAAAAIGIAASGLEEGIPDYKLRKLVEADLWSPALVTQDGKFAWFPVQNRVDMVDLADGNPLRSVGRLTGFRGMLELKDGRGLLVASPKELMLIPTRSSPSRIPLPEGLEIYRVLLQRKKDGLILLEGSQVGTGSVLVALDLDHPEGLKLMNLSTPKMDGTLSNGIVTNALELSDGSVVVGRRRIGGGEVADVADDHTENDLVQLDPDTLQVLRFYPGVRFPEASGWALLLPWASPDYIVVSKRGSVAVLDAATGIVRSKEEVNSYPGLPTVDPQSGEVIVPEPKDLAAVDFSAGRVSRVPGLSSPRFPVKMPGDPTGRWLVAESLFVEEIKVGEAKIRMEAEEARSRGETPARTEEDLKLNHLALVNFQTGRVEGRIPVDEPVIGLQPLDKGVLVTSRDGLFLLAPKAAAQAVQPAPTSGARVSSGLEEGLGVVLVEGIVRAGVPAGWSPEDIYGVTVGLEQTREAIRRGSLPPSRFFVAAGLEEAEAIAQLGVPPDQILRTKEAAIGLAQSLLEKIRGLRVQVLETTARTLGALRVWMAGLPPAWQGAMAGMEEEILQLQDRSQISV